MTARAHILLPLLFAVASPGVVRAQGADTLSLDPDGVMVVGTVIDVTTQGPLSVAQVTLLAQGPDSLVAWRTLSDSAGSFQTPRLVAGAYRVVVSALGFSNATTELVLSGHGAVDLHIELVPDVLELDPIIVTVMRPSRLEYSGFYDRRERGAGRSMTRTEMEARGLRRIDAVFRMLGGVTLVPTPDGSTALRMRGGCRPDFVLDGVRLGPVYRIEDVLSVDNLEGVEVYGPGSVPPQYSRSNCGTVIAWSREPGSTDNTGRPFSWKRLGVAFGFIFSVFLISN